MKKIIQFSNLVKLLSFFYITTNAQVSEISGPTGSEKFGENIVVLPNGNFVVTDPFFDLGATQNVGAVYLYNGITKQLVSTLSGDQANDYVGFGGITILTNGHFVVNSNLWRNNSGAYTWCDANSVGDAVLSNSNSLIGDFPFAGTGSITGKVHALPNGNYVVASPNWNQNIGAVTFCNGLTGRVGTVSTSTSLTGANTQDKIGTSITILSDGNYVVNSENYNSNRGAITWCDATTGLVATVSITNSLVGRRPADSVGRYTYALTNGNYVACVNDWDLDGLNNNIGAVVLCRGPQNAEVNATNAMLGTSAFYGLGNNGITVLNNGNYTFNSPTIFTIGGIQAFGAVTWCSGILPSGQTISSGSFVSASNSIIGSQAGDRVGSHVIALSNGNYVIGSPEWKNGSIQAAGAITWASGTQSTSLVVSTANSLVGSTNYDLIGSNGLDNKVIALSNGNYVVCSESWNNGIFTDAGAVTFCSGTAATIGVINATNSLIGNDTNLKVGLNTIALSNSNYAIGTPNWKKQDYFTGQWNAGAVTVGNGTTGIVGNITVQNSLTIQSQQNFDVGRKMTALTNGNFLVYSNLQPGNGSFGAATLCKGNGSSAGQTISVNNSLTGQANQNSIANKFTALSNGNYFVTSMNLNVNGNAVGAVTLGNGSLATNGQITACNSIIGDQTHQISEGYENIVFNNVYDYLIAGSISNQNTLVQKIFIYDQNNVPINTSNNMVATENIIGNQSFDIIKDCYLLATITPDGANPVLGNVTAKVWFQPTQPFGFAKRHFEIAPVDNPTTATAKVALFFTQQEFNDFNAVSTLDLPTSPTDATGIANISIEKRSGTSSDGSGLPNTYSGAISNINPIDNQIVWNTTQNRWEITFDVVGFGGFFLKTSSPLNSNEFDTHTNQITVYPNPVNDILKIESTSTIDLISVTNLLGQEILNFKTTTSKFEIDFSNFQKGVYFVKVNSENKEKVTKVIKK